MKKSGAAVQIKGLILVLLDKLKGSLCGPVRIVAFEGLLEVSPVNVLGPGETVLFDQLPLKFLELEFLLI